LTSISDQNILNKSTILLDKLVGGPDRMMRKHMRSRHAQSKLLRVSPWRPNRVTLWPTSVQIRVNFVNFI